MRPKTYHVIDNFPLSYLLHVIRSVVLSNPNEFTFYFLTQLAKLTLIKEIYHEFYHCIIYIANEGRHVRINILLFQYNMFVLTLTRVSDIYENGS
jgi:hypothetical protein